MYMPHYIVYYYILAFTNNAGTGIRAALCTYICVVHSLCYKPIVFVIQDIPMSQTRSPWSDTFRRKALMLLEYELYIEAYS